MTEFCVGVLGATGMVGKSLLPLLADCGWRVEAFSRQRGLPGQIAVPGGHVVFRLLDGHCGHADFGVGQAKITHWICLAPVWVLPDYFPWLERHQAKRIVALSSTSVFSKKNSPDTAEQLMAEKLRDGERRLTAWAEDNAIEWVILRPTLIYGMGQDRNISEIARFIARFGFFPLLGAAQGLRQPVHVEDVATACLEALRNDRASNRAYNLSGAEKLPYREMVARVFRVMGKPERFVTVPLCIFRLAIMCLRVLPRFRSWSAAMAERMNADMVFDHADAQGSFGFAPRPFRLGEADLPACGTRHSQ